MKRFPSARIFISLSIAGIVLLILNLFEPFRYFKEAYLRTLSPFIRLVDFPSEEFITMSERARVMGRLVEENELLKDKIDLLRKKQGEYDYMRKVLSDYAQQELSEEFLHTIAQPARLLLSSPEDYLNALTISLGASHGIVSNSPVAVFRDSQWILAGRIDKVYEKFSKLILLTSNDFRCAVITESGYRGVLKGAGSWELTLEYLSPDAELSLGEKVYSDGTGGIIPEGLLVGEISSWESLDFSTGKLAKVQAAFYPQNARRVYILK